MVTKLPAEEMTGHSVERVTPPTACRCEGMTAPNVGFLTQVDTNNLSKKFRANPVTRQTEEQMEQDGNKTPDQLHWQSSKHKNMRWSLQTIISHKDKL